MRLLIGLLSVVGLFLSSCEDIPKFKELPSSVINHHLIVVAKTKDGVRARGFSGATPKGSKVFCAVDRQNNSVISGDDGSFSIEVPSDTDTRFAELDFLIDDKSFSHRYEIKDLAHALSEISYEPFSTDMELDSLAFFGDRVAILSSNASLVHLFAVDKHFALDDKIGYSVLLNAAPTIPVGARMIAKLGPRLLAPLFQTHEVALIDITTPKVLQRTTLRNPQGKPYVFDVNPPLVVKNPIDADGSGKKSTKISKTTARNAEAVISLDDKHFLASFANYYQVADFTSMQNSVVGPGVVALMRADDEGIKTLAVAVLRFKNPQHFVIKDDHTVWVACTGDWNFVNKTLLASNNAGLVKLGIAKDFKALAVEHEIDLKEFSPAEPVLIRDKLIVPRSWNNEVAVIEETATALTNEHKRVAKFHRPLAFTFAARWHDTTIFLGESAGSLIAFDMDEGFFPFPFVEPIVLNKEIGKEITLEPIKAYFRHVVEKTDYVHARKPGFDAWVLTAAHQLYPLDFLRVFGP